MKGLKESRRFIKGKNTDYPWRQHSPLQGFAKCPTCNHILGFVQSKRPRLDGSVRVHKYFHCRICKCNNVEHKNSRAEKLEEQVLALIKEKYGEVGLEAKKTSDFEKYKLGKITKLKIIESKKSIDKELESLLERIEELSKQDDIVKDTELTRELMEKYIDSVLCEGSIVQKIIWK